jgi:hypothetical protein
MSRTLLGLLLGGTLVLFVTGCAQQTSETTPAEVESSAPEVPDVGDSESQSPDSNERPIVTVNLSPT